MEQSGWYGVRCVFEVGDAGAAHRTYEERVTIWQARDEDAAIALAAREAEEYASNIDVAYLGLAQSYAMADDLGQGAEVFSLMRDSDAPPDEYVRSHFVTGNERLRPVE